MFPVERQILAAARPIARSLLDIPLPTQAVFERHRSGCRSNLIAMNEILRDRERSTIRLVMNPDKMVIGEAMRTFTYLNLYGYLTDAVIVNRIFPADVGDYFAGWRRVQEEHLELVRVGVRAGAGAVRARTSTRRSSGAEMLDRLGGALFGPTGSTRRRCCTTRSPRSCGCPSDEARLRLALPFARKGDISLKKIGLELVVGVDGQRRTIMLPPALAAFQPDRGHVRGRRARGDASTGAGRTLMAGEERTPARACEDGCAGWSSGWTGPRRRPSG